MFAHTCRQTRYKHPAVFNSSMWLIASLYKHLHLSQGVPNFLSAAAKSATSMTYVSEGETGVIWHQGFFTAGPKHWHVAKASCKIISTPHGKKSINRRFNPPYVSQGYTGV